MRAVIKVTPFTPVSPADAGPRLPPHRVLIPSRHLILCLMVLATTGVRPLPSKGRGPLDTGGEYFEAACIRCIVSTTTSTTEHVLMTSAVTFFVYQIASAWEFCMPCTTWDWRSSQHPPSTVNNVAPRGGTRWGCRGQPGTTPHPANSLRVTGSRASKRSHYHHVSAGATGRDHRTSTPGTTQSCPAVERPHYYWGHLAVFAQHGFHQYKGLVSSGTPPSPAPTVPCRPQCPPGRDAWRGTLHTT